MPARRACDVCYKRKIQCLIEKRGDPCEWCGSQGVSCTFDRVIQKNPNKRTTSDVVTELSTRVEELEEALQSARSTAAIGHDVTSPWTEASASSYGPQYSASPSHAARGQPVKEYLTLSAESAPSPANTHPSTSSRLSRCQLGNNWYFKGVGILSARGRQWISYGAGQDVFLENFNIFEDPFGREPNHSSIALLHQPQTLPPESVCRFLFDKFIKSETSTIFPILEPCLFEETIARAYDPKPPDMRRRSSAEACIWGMLALAGRTKEPQRHQSSTLDVNICIQELRRLLVMVKGAGNLDNLQAILLLWTYEKMKGQCCEASTTFTNACRLVCDLGGHFLVSGLTILPQHVPYFDEPSTLHIRRLFWFCYCTDKDMALRTGASPLLASDYCDLRITGDLRPGTPWYNLVRDINLAKIKEDASRLLCSPRAFRYTDGELLSRVRQLDDELEEWRLSIEPSYRPRLSIPPESSISLPRASNVEDCMHIIRLQLDYLFTMINIHTLVRKCGDFERNLPDDLHSVVHSSADLSIEASRSIFRFLETVVAFWKQDSVWIVSHYAPMAAMPLFVNILIHPLGNPADNDLQILASIGNITRKIPTERLHKDEIDHLEEISQFVMELVRLGHSAAWKAKRGEREHDLDIIHE